MQFVVPLNDLGRHESSDIEALEHRVGQVIRSGRYFNGQETASFKLSMSDIVGGRHFIPVGNGTDALILALEALRLPTGAKVAVAPNAGGYGTIAAIRAGLRVVFIDVDLVSAQMSPLSLEQSLRVDPEIGAVIMTHLYGQIGDVKAIADICSSRGIPLIEDCAQSFGAMHSEQQVGTFGDIATFSFYPTKNLGALGDAGGIATKSQDLITTIERLSQYGWSERYTISLRRGFNSRMDEVQASFLNHNLPKTQQWNKARRAIVKRFSDALSSDRRMIGTFDESFVAHLAIMVSPARDHDRAFLHKLGIETAIHYPILDSEQPAWAVGSSDTPNALQLTNEILTLPCFPTMTDSEIDRVCNALSTLGE